MHPVAPPTKRVKADVNDEVAVRARRDQLDQLRAKQQMRSAKGTGPPKAADGPPLSSRGPPPPGGPMDRVRHSDIFPTVGKVAGTTREPQRGPPAPPKARAMAPPPRRLDPAFEKRSTSARAPSPSRAKSAPRARPAPPALPPSAVKEAPDSTPTRGMQARPPPVTPGVVKKTARPPAIAVAPPPVGNVPPTPKATPKGAPPRKTPMPPQPPTTPRVPSAPPTPTPTLASAGSAPPTPLLNQSTQATQQPPVGFSPGQGPPTPVSSAPPTPKAAPPVVPVLNNPMASASIKPFAEKPSVAGVAAPAPAPFPVQGAAPVPTPEPEAAPEISVQPSAIPKTEAAKVETGPPVGAGPPIVPGPAPEVKSRQNFIRSMHEFADTPTKPPASPAPTPAAAASGTSSQTSLLRLEKEVREHEKAKTDALRRVVELEEEVQKLKEKGAGQIALETPRTSAPQVRDNRFE